MADPYRQMDRILSPEEALADARRQIDELQTQLVAVDQILEGNFELAQRLAPGAFEIRRKHAALRLPRAVLELAFPSPSRGCRDEVYLQWLWKEQRPQRHYVSCALTKPGQYELADRSRSQPDPVSGKSLQWGENSLWRSGSYGLPKDCKWLVTSWNLEVRADPAEWEWAGIDGCVSFRYNDKDVQRRPLSDALRGQDLDLLLVMEEQLEFKVSLDCRQAAIPRGEGPWRTTPRLFVNLDCIERPLPW